MKKIKEKMRYLLFFVFNPMQLIMNQKYNKEWDLILSEGIDNELITFIDEFDAELIINSTRYSIWIGNYPYAYGTTRIKCFNRRSELMQTTTMRPSRWNIWRLGQLQSEEIRTRTIKIGEEIDNE